jgi:hypothetical protein
MAKPDREGSARALRCAALQTARKAVSDADEDGVVDLARFGKRVGIRVADARPVRKRDTGIFLIDTGTRMPLPGDQEILTIERYALTRYLMNYLRLIGELGWQIGREISPVGVLQIDGQTWHADGKHRIVCGRMLDVEVRARLYR